MLRTHELPGIDGLCTPGPVVYPGIVEFAPCITGAVASILQDLPDLGQRASGPRTEVPALEKKLFADINIQEAPRQPDNKKTIPALLPLFVHAKRCSLMQ